MHSTRLRTHSETETKYGTKLLLKLESAGRWFYMPSKFSRRSCIANVHLAIKTNNAYLHLKSINKTKKYVDYDLEIVDGKHLNTNL